MAQELTFNITEDVRRLKRPTAVKDFRLSFGHADQGPTDVVIGDDGNIVQGRYGDSARQVFVNVVQGKNNEPVDITGYLPEFNGCIPDAEHIVIDNWDGVLVDPRHGRFRFDFPIQAFTVAGSYKQAYFRLVQNGTGKTLATLEFDMQVLEDFVYSNIVPQDYVTPYLDMINKLKDAYTNFVGKTQDSFDQAKKRLDDIMSTVEDKADTVEQRLKTDEQTLTELSKKIDEKGLFTQAEADAFKQEIQKQIDKFGDTSSYTEPGESFVEKVINETDDRGINVRHFDIKADGKTDDSTTIQQAIDRAIELFPRVNTVVIPGGTYKIDSTLIIPPYIKLRSAGLVTFISSSPQPVAWVKWLGKQDPDIVGKPLGTPYYNSDWQRGAIFGGQGGFSFISTLDKADGIGLELGFDNKDDSARNGSSAKSVSRYTLGDISISGFKVGLKLNATDLYIAKHSNLHIENNETGILFAIGGSINSGESITFDNCAIAHCQQAFDCQYNSADFSLINCCLDFNDLVFKTYERPDFNISVINGNIEGNKRIIDCSASTSAEFKPTLSINGSVVYVRNYQLTNPDTAQFKGPLVLNLTNAYLIAHNNINEISYLCDSNVIVDRQGSLRTGRRDGKRYLLAERFNRFIHGHNLQLSALANGKSDNGKVELRTKDNGLSKGMQDTLLPSALVYEHKASDGSNWDKLTFSQHIDVSRSSSYALSTWLSFQGKDTFAFKVNFYTSDGYLVRSDDVYFYDAIADGKPHFMRSFAKDIPYYSDYATIEVTETVRDVGNKMELGYIGFEC